MPTLTEILDDPACNGVYRLTDHPAGSGDSFGMEKPLYGPLPERPDILRMDARRCPDKESLLVALGNTLQFPDYYGRNWDALEECLFDLSWWTGPVILLIEHADALARETRATLADIWTEAATAWAEVGRVCVLLLADADAGTPSTQPTS